MALSRKPHIIAAAALSLTLAGTEALADRAGGREIRLQSLRNGNSGGILSGFPTFFDFSRKKSKRQEKKRSAPRIVRPSKPAYYTYRADRLVALRASGLQQPTPNRPVFGGALPEGFDPMPDDLGVRPLDDQVAQKIFETLRDGTSRVRLLASEASALIAFYKARDFKPLWTNADGIRDRGSLTLDYLQRAGAEGLDPSDYHVAIWNETGGQSSEIAADPARLSRFDIELSAAALRYARHAAGGRIHPNRISPHHDLKPPVPAASAVLASLAKRKSARDYLAGLHPQHPAYRAFRRELLRLGYGKSAPVAKIQVPAGPILRPGDTGSRISLLRKRLKQEGYLTDEAASEEKQSSLGEMRVMTAGLDAGEAGMPKFGGEHIRSKTPDEDETGPVADPAFYDDELAQAVRKFQKEAGLTPDAVVGPATLRAFAGKPGKSANGIIRSNMERLRWLPRNFGRTHILVNQAAFSLKVIENGRQIWQTRVIVGKPRHQTAFFSDTMQTVVFNPYWGVPQSILANEMLPRLQNDPSYLDRQGYEIYNKRGRKVSSSNVDWWTYQGKVPFSVRQPPGRSNALGEVKFLFPNKHAIYLHDTPSKSLFKRSSRAFSHGCVRVQNPRQLAQKLLGWSQSRIADKIAQGANAQIPIQKTVRVHLTYFTAWPDADGRIHTFKDIYGRDARLDMAFRAEQQARN